LDIDDKALSKYRGSSFIIPITIAVPDFFREYLSMRNGVKDIWLRYDTGTAQIWRRYGESRAYTWLW
jgi:hypothetical protein